MKKSHYATMTKSQNRSMWQAYKDGVHWSPNGSTSVIEMHS